MASSLKAGMPKEIFVIFNGYEVRYYTTPETFAQAVSDGYAHHHTSGTPYEVKCFVPVELADDQVSEQLDLAVQQPPPPFVPSAACAAPVGVQPWSINLTTTVQAAVAAATAQYEKEQKTYRGKTLKAWRGRLLDDIYTALRRTRP